MDSSKISALLLTCMLLISSATPILGCGTCNKPKHKGSHKGKGSPKAKGSPKGPITLPPIVKPPIRLPPVTLPPIVKPPVTLPPIVKPPINLPLPPVVKPPINLPLPPVVKPPITVPPVTVPPVTVPPVTVPPVTIPPVTTKPPCPKRCPSPPGKNATCPINTLKLGACVDLLGGLVHIGLGDPVVNECCPVLQGLAELEAAICLCTTLKLKLLNLNVYVPLAVQLLITCGKTPPSGYTCTL